MSHKTVLVDMIFVARAVGFSGDGHKIRLHVMAIRYHHHGVVLRWQICFSYSLKASNYLIVVASGLIPPVP